MGCVSSNLLSHDDGFASAFSSHIVSLTSTTYGLLSLDPIPLSKSKPLGSDPQNSAFFSPLTPPKPCTIKDQSFGEENSDPSPSRAPKPPGEETDELAPAKPSLDLDRFERLCPPNGENRVVVYTTSLRGVRKTFDACNSVRAAIEGLGVALCERDVSMDGGFREELRDLLKGKAREESVPPRVFVKGRYVGGAEELLTMAEDGILGELLHGLPRRKAGSSVCEGCGDMKFLPCFHCNGSCKIVKEEEEKEVGAVVIRCSYCNENGLTPCPICT